MPDVRMVIRLSPRLREGGLDHQFQSPDFPRYARHIIGVGANEGYWFFCYSNGETTLYERDRELTEDLPFKTQHIPKDSVIRKVMI